MSATLYGMFLVTTLMMVMVPGPSAITVISQGATNPPRHAMLGVLGVVSADLGFFLLSATGIASLLVASSWLFAIIKWCGVAYLVYLGLSALLGRQGAITVSANAVPRRPRQLYLQAMIVHFANPKALLYFVALLPQFIDPARPLAPQLALMGATCLTADFVVYTLFSRLGTLISRQGLKQRMLNTINRIAGLTLLTTGVRMISLER